MMDEAGGSINEVGNELKQSHSSSQPRLRPGSRYDSWVPDTSKNYDTTKSTKNWDFGLEIKCWLDEKRYPINEQ